MIKKGKRRSPFSGRDAHTREPERNCPRTTGNLTAFKAIESDMAGKVLLEKRLSFLSWNTSFIVAKSLFALGCAASSQKTRQMDD